MRVKVSWGPKLSGSHPWGGRSGGLQDTDLLTALGRTRVSGLMSIRCPHTYELVNGYAPTLAFYAAREKLLEKAQTYH
jgi:hypothetical protein